MIQTVEQSIEEKRAMYMSMTKEQLVEMLIACNNAISTPNVYELKQISCDGCGCHPNLLYTSDKGRFCIKCTLK